MQKIGLRNLNLPLEILEKLASEIRAYLQKLATNKYVNLKSIEFSSLKHSGVLEKKRSSILREERKRYNLLCLIGLERDPW